MKTLSVGLAVLPVSAILLAQPVWGQEQQPPMGNTSSEQMQHMIRMQGQADANIPTMPGQDAFGAIQEILHILEADPNTDWSKVNLEALRQHLIDMNEVTLKADAMTKPIDNGIEVTVTGKGRTVEAIQRMVPAHVQEIEQTHLNGWSAKTEPLPNGVVLTVTSDDPKQVNHLRGLGFMGVMASGSHHQAHHLAIARGEVIHTH
jgi:hypothetical protein